MKGERIILAAHRGDRVKWPENTMPAFLASVDHGVNMIETDVRMTRDGELVLSVPQRKGRQSAGLQGEF